MRDGRLTQLCQALRQTMIKYDNTHDVVFVTKDLNDASQCAHGGLVLQSVDVDLLIREMVTHMERGRYKFVLSLSLTHTHSLSLALSLSLSIARSFARSLAHSRARSRSLSSLNYLEVKRLHIVLRSSIISVI
jgi:DNA recombination-dependent growth factor C